MNKQTLIPSIVLGVAVLAGVAAYTSASSAANTDQQATIADSLAQKLNIDKSQVSTALDQVKQERQVARQEERKTEISANLDKAVNDGVITADQKQKLIDKENEIQAQVAKQRADLEQWYKDNGIDQSKLRSYIGKGGHGHGGRGMGPGMMWP